MKNCYAKLITLFLIICMISSCNSEKKEKKYTIGFSQCTGLDDWRKTMLSEMKRELSFHNNVEFIYQNADGNSEKQIRQIKYLIKQNIDLLIVSPNEVKPLSPIIQEVYDRNIPVLVVDRRTDSKKYTAFIGASNYEVGQNAGRYAASILNGKGEIMEVTGLPDASPVIDRHNGFMDILSKYPNLKYVQRIDDNSKPFLKKQEEALIAHPNINLIYAQNDFMAYDSYLICKKLGRDKKIKIIGIDGLPIKGAGLDMIENKYISASILYPTGGQEAIITAMNIIERKPFNTENQLATTVIDSTNVRIMKSQSNKVLQQQKDIEERQKKINEQIIITKNQSILILFISTALIVVVIFGSILFYSLSVNKKIRRTLMIQNLEISEQKNQLIEISAKAESAHQAKLSFFTNISHEFRTPLTLILSPIEELIDNPKIQHSTKLTLQLIQKNVLRLYRLVNQLMDFRKIEFNKMQLRASQVDLIGFVNEITSSYEVLAKNKHINLNFFTSEKLLNVWFDVTMIDKVIFNLLSNAFKFTKENGYIHVTISKNNQYAIIKVEDNGVGMSQDLIEHAFDPFFQGEYENYKGTGLGLALSKELIEIHHGTIDVRSEKWKGTSFEVKLPLGKNHLKPEEMVNNVDSRSLITEDAKIYTTELFDRLQDPSENNEISKNKKYCILIIEDNYDLRNYLKNRLISNYDILDAEDANVALQLTFDNIPDLIISDVVIPGKTGLEIASIIKSDIRTAHIPIVLLTSRNEETHKLEGLKTKADAYITKPFNFQILEQTVATLLDNREKIKNHYSTEILTETKSQTSKKTDRKFISEFAAIVEENISNDQFGIEDICSKIGMSRIQLYRKVKAILNTNVNDYIISTRLQKAKYYLQHEDISISEVAFKTGFSSATYFSTTFKNSFGMTPKDFKSKKAI